MDSTNPRVETQTMPSYGDRVRVAFDRKWSGFAIGLSDDGDDGVAVLVHFDDDILAMVDVNDVEVI